MRRSEGTPDGRGAARSPTSVSKTRPCMHGDIEATMNMTQILLVVLARHKSDPLFIGYARAVHEHVKDNLDFPDLKPTPDEFKNDLTAYEDAQTKLAARGSGLAEARNVARRKVKVNLWAWRGQIQSAIQMLTPEEAAKKVASTFLSLKKSTKSSRPPFSAKNTASGAVTLYAKAVARKATYYWEYSLDQETWTSAPDTLTAKTTITGLTPGKMYHFRFRALKRELKQNAPVGYSYVVSLYVA